MIDPRPPQPPRPKFDTLFVDPRHFRGDCRLVRTAVRRGWLNDVPQADRDALGARFSRAMDERKAAGFASPGQEARAILAWVAAGIGIEGENQRDLHRALRYVWAGDFTGRATGRPRERRYVTDYTGRIDANDLRRRALADGIDLGTLRSVTVTPTDAPDDAGVCGGWGERVALAVSPDRRYGWRVWLVCPRCQRRRTHLYPVRAGIRCRACAGIAYRAGG